jgi:uncharacterized protein (UPF0335 family)
MKKTLILVLFIVTGVCAQRIEKINNEVVKILDNKGNIYKIRISATDNDSTILQKYIAIKQREVNPTTKSKTELMSEAIRKELGTPEQQLEMIYNDMVNNTTVWQDKRTEIKNRFK